MNPFGITVTSALLAVALWLAWLTSRPSVKPLLDSRQRKSLCDKMPEGTADGNATVLYTDFNPMLDDMLRDIADAQNHIHLQFFKFETDYVCQRIGNALMQKADEGVEVRLMYDHIINLKNQWYYDYLSQHGVQTLGFGRTHLPFLRKSDNYRNHRKVVVIDGRVGYLGGMNIAQRYLEGLDWGPWCDTQLRIDGPATAQLQQAFLADWCHASSQLLDSRQYFPTLRPVGDQHIDILTSGPIGDGPTIMHRTVQLLDQSRDYIYFESPYFIPTPEVMRALCAAAHRGVDVRLLIPARSDRGLLVLPASMSYLAEALKAGVKIGLFQKGYLHSKTIVADDAVAHVGSTNIDKRSYLLDLEIGAYVYNRDFACQIKQQFLADEAGSEYIDLAQWQGRPLTQKIFERTARLISSQL